MPPVGWMAVIWWLSSDSGSAEHTRAILLPVLRALLPSATPAQLEMVHGIIRKLAHFMEYGILAWLWFRAFVRGGGVSRRASGWAALGVSVAWAILDEIHQSAVPSRTASVYDVMIDAAGVMAAVLILRSVGVRP